MTAACYETSTATYMHSDSVSTVKTVGFFLFFFALTSCLMESAPGSLMPCSSTSCCTCPVRFFSYFPPLSSPHFLPHHSILGCQVNFGVDILHMNQATPVTSRCSLAPGWSVVEAQATLSLCHCSVEELPVPSPPCHGRPAAPSATIMCEMSVLA